MDYSRQNLIEGLTIPKVVSVVGCGGTGFWVAYLLAMQGTEEIILFDDDKVEESNLARLPLQSDHTGSFKVDALIYEISRIRHPRLEKHIEKIDSPDKCIYLRGKVFCCTDNIPSQQLIWSYCKKNGLYYQRVGYDGTTLCVTESFPLTFDDPNALPAGYETTPSWVVPAVIAAAAGISSQCLKGGKITLMDDIRRLHIQDCSNLAGDIAKKLRKDGANNVVENPYDYGLGDCDECDKGDCDDCDKISSNDYDTMRDIVCDGCDWISPEDRDNDVRVAIENTRKDILVAILDGNEDSEIKAAIESRYTLIPKDIPGQMHITDLTGGANNDVG